MNTIKLQGTITTDPRLIYESFGEKFYKVYLSTARNSGTCDIIPCVISETIVELAKKGDKVGFIGGIRTDVEYDEEHNRHISVFVKVHNMFDYEQDENVAVISGNRLKTCNLRVTPRGITVCDFTIASVRESNLRDYIPCIAWHETANKLYATTETGEKLRATGRLQSRIYTKKYDDGTEKEYTVNELSVSRFTSKGE